MLEKNEENDVGLGICTRKILALKYRAPKESLNGALALCKLSGLRGF